MVLDVPDERTAPSRIGAVGLGPDVELRVLLTTGTGVSRAGPSPRTSSARTLRSRT